MVKADGYGLGAGPVARRLHGEGARRFFVARLAEGEALRKALAGLTAEIYVLDGAPAGASARLAAADLIPVVGSVEQLAEWAAHARGGPALPVAIHVDTGMNRLGFAESDFRTLRARGRLEAVRVVLVMSHLACADEPGHPLNASQQARFAELRAYFPDARASLANSAGVFLGPGYAFDVVRPGISLYGGGPRGRTDPRIRQVATLEAPILQVREVAQGESVGYGATFTADRPLRGAILAAGYADGIFRVGAPRASAWLHGGRRRYLGRVSMDLIAVDVTDAPEAKPGELVQLLGPEAPVDEVAGWAGTLAYELLVRLAPRAERRHLGEA